MTLLRTITFCVNRTSDSIALLIVKEDARPPQHAVPGASSGGGSRITQCILFRNGTGSGEIRR